MTPAVLGVDRERPGEVVFQLEQKRIEVRTAVIGIENDARNVRVESNTTNRADVVQVVVRGQMAGRASLISNGSDPLMAQVALDSQCVVIGGCRGPVRRQRGQRRSARRGQIVRAEGHDTRRIGCISVGIANIRRETIDIEDVTSRKRRSVLNKRRIETHVQRVGLTYAVVGDSESAAHDGQSTKIVSMERPRTPRKAKLRPKIVGTGSELVAARADSHVCEETW